jgi:medium-chain acyl-[acyl-carrier-protein] hydrolase
MEFLQKYTPQKLVVRYIKEITYGHQVESSFDFAKNEDQSTITTRHQIKVDQALHAEANISWREITEPVIF